MDPYMSIKGKFLIYVALPKTDMSQGKVKR